MTEWPELPPTLEEMDEKLSLETVVIPSTSAAGGILSVELEPPDSDLEEERRRIRRDILAYKDQKILVIKLCKERTGWRLKRAKYEVDAQWPIPGGAPPVRLYHMAKMFGIPSRAFLDKLEEIGFHFTNTLTCVSAQQALIIRRDLIAKWDHL